MSTANDAPALAAYVAAMQQQHGHTPLVRDGALVDQRDEDRFAGWRLRGEAQAEQQAVPGSAREALAAFNETLVPDLRVPDTLTYRVAMTAALSSTAAPAPVAGEAVAWINYEIDTTGGENNGRTGKRTLSFERIAAGHDWANATPLAALAQDRASQAGAAGSVS